jgi:uncharacterized protein YdeI (YjbR/CyaY-like superfamily)
MVSFADKPLLFVQSVAEWERFLENDPPDHGVRLQLVKKTRDAPGIRYPEALDVALCFGWIDGQLARLDDDYVLQSFTPRRARSPWSQINREHVERLVAAGRMRPGGQAEVDRAKGDGRWDAAYRQRDVEIDPDFAAALAASPAATETFEALTKQRRFAFHFRLAALRRPETRAKRIAEFVASLERGENLG